MAWGQLAGSEGLWAGAACEARLWEAPVRGVNCPFPAGGVRRLVFPASCPSSLHPQTPRGCPCTLFICRVASGEVGDNSLMGPKGGHPFSASTSRFNAWAAVFGVTRLFILTLAVLAIGFGLARMENQAFDPEKGNFNTLLCR